MEREEIKRILEEHHQEYLDRWPPELRAEREVLWLARRTIVQALTEKARAKLNLQWLEALPEAEKGEVRLESFRAKLDESLARVAELKAELIRLDREYKEKGRAYGPDPLSEDRIGGQRDPYAGL